MKRALLLIVLGAAIGGGIVWMTNHHEAAGKPDADEAKPAADEAQKTTVTHDEEGNVVVGMSDETQGAAGIVVTNPAPSQWSPEIKAFGHVIDPAALATQVADLATARAAYAASSNELARLKTLEGQGNASTRALQSAEAAAIHDQLAFQSAQDHLALTWSHAVAGRESLSTFVQSLTSQESALVRLEVPAGESFDRPPSGARVVTLAGASGIAEFFGTASSVDPQVQGRGFLFYLPTNSLRCVAGEAVTGYLDLGGTPVAGVVVPRDAVVRTEGKGWVYVLNGNGESFTRREIALDRPADAGWFVTGIKAENYVVVTGAQTLLSEELKASMSAD